jgi:acyl carrier protein phosphodiesterase
MAINVILQSIHGDRRDEVVDFDYCLARVWPSGDPSFPLLQYIDPYGNTVFNGLQMPEVQKELKRLIAMASNDDQRKTLQRICELAAKCQERPQTFLRFRGD